MNCLFSFFREAARKAKLAVTEAAGTADNVIKGAYKRKQVEVWYFYIQLLPG